MSNSKKIAKSFFLIFNHFLKDFYFIMINGNNIKISDFWDFEYAYNLKEGYELKRKPSTRRRKLKSYK